MYKILIIGSRGQLGFDLVKVFSNDSEIFLADRPLFDVENFVSCKKLIEKVKPNFVLNTAAYHKTIECEKNPEKSFSVNAIGAYNVAIASKIVNATVVYYSTDYVFDGSKKSFTEEDKPNPLNVYGTSKLSGEILTSIGNNKSYIIRTSWLFGNHLGSKGPNFVENMLSKAKENENISVVSDQIGSPTYTIDLAIKTKEIIEKEIPFGVYHITNSGHCSWYEFAKEIFRQSKVNIKVNPAKTHDDGIKRPKYSTLSNKKFDILDIDKLRNWKEALREYFKQRNAKFINKQKL